MAEPLRITVHPARFTPGPVSGAGDDLVGTDGAWGASAPDHNPEPAAGPSKPEDIDGAWGASRADHSEETEKAAKTLHRDVSQAEAFGRSAATGATFGLAPALEGVAGASGKPEPSTISERASGGAASRPILGALGLIKEAFTGEGDATKAYRKARDEAQAALDAGRQQYPITSLAGELTGAVAVPIPGLAALAAPARIARGAAAGAAGGAAYGAGTAISKGKDADDTFRDAMIQGAMGAPIGGLFAGILGPRLAGAANTPGQRAAQTARDLGAPLPRGVTADSRFVQATTSKMRQVPFAGERIGQAVDATQEAAGNRIGQIAAGGRGAAPDRALAGATLRPALQGIQQDNNARIDMAYHALRHVIDPHLFASQTNTRAAVDAILRQRRGARMANPEAGLGDVLSLIRGGGISFNGLQRARNDLGTAIEFASARPNPGFNLADLRRIYAAMSADMEAAVRRHARIHPDRAADVLNHAHAVAQQLIERNGAIQRVLNVQADERLVGSLITAAQERTGNLRLLTQLRAGMHPDDFHHLAGTMLAELGHNNATGEFSLNQFVRNWERVSDRARAILFSPQHLRNIEDIVGMGRHIQGALRESSTSHSASLLVLLDVAKDVALLSADVASGGLGAGSAIGAGTTAGLWVLARWLGNPATVSSMAAWSRARVGLLGHPTPARLAAFNIATRNLSHNLGVPMESIAKRLPVPVNAEPAEDNKPKAPRPLGQKPGTDAPRAKDQSRVH